MFRYISSIGLRTRFVLIGIAVLVPLVAVMLQLAQYERETALASAEQRVKLFASLTADRQRKLVNRAEIVLSQLADEWRALSGNGGCNAFVAAALASHEWMAGLRLSAFDGSSVCADGPGAMERNISGFGYFTEVLAGRPFTVSDQLVHRGVSNPIVVAAVPVTDGSNSLIGVLSAAMELGAVADLLPVELRDDPNVVVDIIDRNGALLARHPHAPELVGQPVSERAVVQKALTDPTGTAELPDLKGATRLFAYQAIDPVGWVVAVGIDRQSVVGPIDTALHKRLLLIAAIVVSSCIGGLIGGEFFVFRPLRELARTAQALERGDMTARARMTGLSEVGALERSLNRMAEAIQQRQSDLKQSQAALEQAVNDTRQANEAKSQFLASMSHEIRTPLGGIVGFNDLLLAQSLTPEQHRYAERIAGAAAAVITVIDGILDIARIEAREVEIEQRPFVLASLVDSAVSMVRTNAERKGLRLAVELAPDLPEAVLGDEARLRQVLLNLLSNAVKFTASGGVTLKVDRAGSGARVCFSVRDTGIGIAKNQHHKLFKRFSQAHDRSRGYGGSGLGLAISKQLADLMGGELGFSSEAGKGSIFWVELPLPQTEPPAVQRETQPVQSPRVARILVADDDEMNREVASAMLTLAGHEVDVVSDGAQAVNAIQQKAYDLVLLDIEMRGMNGMVAIGRIRRLDPPARHVPVIAMTANVMPQQIRAFRKAGMNEHLGKPFTNSQLIDKVNLLLSPARAPAGWAAKSRASHLVDYDNKALIEMQSLLGEKRTAAWLRTLRTQIEAIASIDKKPVNRHELAMTAHTLVSQAGSLGFNRLSRLSSELEEACFERTDYTDALGQVKKACRAALSRIDRIQNSPPIHSEHAVRALGTYRK